MVRPDIGCVLVPGPWEHRYVSANGARFHIADTGGTGPLVVLLHSFPQFWWTWRSLLELLPQAGYRAVAMDLRGYGASDKPPGGYDGLTLTADVAAVIRSLGMSGAVVIGHGLGGWLAWATPYHHPEVIRAISVVASPHPLAYHRAMRTSPSQLFAQFRHRRLHPPYRPEQRFIHDPGYVDRILRHWAAPHGSWPSRQVSERYAQAMAIPFAAHCALDSFRWLMAAPWRIDGRRFLATLREPLAVPVLAVHGDRDPLFLPESTRRSERFATANFRMTVVPGAGHFVPEEAPDATAEAVLSWLDRL